VTVRDHRNGSNAVHVLHVPEDRYIWHVMEEENIELPASCRNGCCTTCAVRIESGVVEQGEALGLLKEMRDVGYALLCVSYARSDLTCSLQSEDEVYDRQFGSSFESGGIEWGGVMPEDD
jgi:ferredoxin